VYQPGNVDVSCRRGFHRPEENAMEPTHWMLAGVIGLAIGVPVVGFIILGRILRKDEAIDAATFLALRQLRERVEQSRRQP
jgi:hypothetical protein